MEPDCLPTCRLGPNDALHDLACPHSCDPGAAVWLSLRDYLAVEDFRVRVAEIRQDCAVDGTRLVLLSVYGSLKGEATTGVLAFEIDDWVHLVVNVGEALVGAGWVSQPSDTMPPEPPELAGL